MCVIIHKPAGIDFKREDLLKSFENNPDGFGWMFYDEESKRIIAQKDTKFSAETIADWMEGHTDTDLVVHYRYRTTGPIKKQTCHPFKILDKEKDGMDMYFMHNGTIREAGELVGESDTQAFNKNFLKPLLKANPKMIESVAFRLLIEKYISSFSKLVFMYDDGKIIKFNEDEGVVVNDCWCSNDRSFIKNWRYNKNRPAVTTTYSNRGPYQAPKSRTSNASGVKTTVSRVTAGKDRTTKLLDEEVGVGSEVYVWSAIDDQYFGFGTITEVTMQNHIQIEFTDKGGCVAKKMFLGKDGNTIDTAKDYYVTSANPYEPAEDAAKTVGDVLKKSKDSEAKADKSTQEATTGKTNITDIAEVRANLAAEVKKSQKQKQLETTGTSQATSTDKEIEDISITYKDTTINDPYDNFGGARVEATTCVYGKYNFQMLNDMDIEQRLEFFVDEQEIAFNMFQDLIEYINLEDEDYYEDDPLLDYDKRSSMTILN